MLQSRCRFKQHGGRGGVSLLTSAAAQSPGARATAVDEASPSSAASETFPGEMRAACEAVQLVAGMCREVQAALTSGVERCKL